jgi:hypothetical protein
MRLCVLRATDSIDVNIMKTVAETVSTILDVDYDLITEPFGDYNPDVVLQRLAELRSRYLDDHDSAALFLLFDEHAVESHGATVLGRAIAQSRIAVVRWKPDLNMTAAICLHELGHALGLTNRHCDREECLMYPYAREMRVQGKQGLELFCEECWRTITTDTIYESLHNASQERRSSLKRGIDQVRATLTATSDRIRRPKPLMPKGIIHSPQVFPDLNDYQDERLFLHAVLRYYGVGQDSEEAAE